jgi:putative LysE/RhtB family amino acid efflux pump
MMFDATGTALIRGVIAGFAVAAPVGPIGILCIRRTLAHGPSIGFASGAGAATADAVYGVIAALGIGAVTAFLLGNATILKICGGAFLLWLGWGALSKAFRATKSADSPHINVAVSGLAAAFGSTFALTITNPMTIIAFIGMMGALVDHDRQENASIAALALVVGVFAGSIAWWSILVSGVTFARKAVSPAAMQIIEFLSALALIAFGLFAILGGVQLF